MQLSLTHRHLPPGLVALPARDSSQRLTPRGWGFVASRWSQVAGRAAALHLWLRRLARLSPEFWLAPSGTSAVDVLSGLSRASGWRTVSACDVPADPPPTSRSSLRWSPSNDERLLLELDHVAVLWLRERSHTAEKLFERLAKRRSKWTTFIPLDERLVPKPLLNELLLQGATGVRLHEDSDLLTIDVGARVETFDLPSISSWPWLTHCTRSGEGKRAGESRVEFFERIALGPTRALGNGLEVLATILEQQRIIARSGAIRGEQRVTCWSATPLAERLSQRTYRKGRRHWDDASYGIAISRELAEACHLKPVVYGDEAMFRGLPLEERSFFQPSSSSSVEWSQEQEWRGIGDFSLRSLPQGSIWAFVPSEREAEWLRCFTDLLVFSLEQISETGRWPDPDSV